MSASPCRQCQDFFDVQPVKFTVVADRIGQQTFEQPLCLKCRDLLLKDIKLLGAVNRKL